MDYTRGAISVDSENFEINLSHTANKISKYSNSCKISQNIWIYYIRIYIYNWVKILKTAAALTTFL